MDDLPFDDIAEVDDRGEREDEDILHGVFYQGVSFFIELFHQEHAFFHHSEVMFDSHSAGIVRQGLDGVVEIILLLLL